MTLKNKKALSVIIGVLLLLSLTSIVGVSMYYWFTSFSSEYQVKQQNEMNIRDVDILGIKYLSRNRAQVGVRNSGEGYHVVNRITINGEECDVIGPNVVESVSNLYVDCPTVIDENYEISIYSDKGISSRSFTSFEVGVDTQENLQLPSNLTVEFRNSDTCELWQTKIYGLEFMENAHAEVPSEDNYPYSVCVNHSVYTLGTNCAGQGIDEVFDLGDTTNTHAWRDRSSARSMGPSYYNWNTICLDALNDAANIEIIEASSRPDENFVCIGSMTGDDFNGRSLGDCSTDYDDLLWLRIYHTG